MRKTEGRVRDLRNPYITHVWGDRTYISERKTQRLYIFYIAYVEKNAIAFGSRGVKIIALRQWYYPI